MIWRSSRSYNYLPELEKTPSTIQDIFCHTMCGVDITMIYVLECLNAGPCR